MTPMTPMTPMTRQVLRPRICVATGPRAVEAALLARLAPLLAEARANPALLATPIRVLVPSRSLREHLSAVLVSRFGAVAGVSIQTLHALALEILERAREPAPRGEELLPVLVRRAARQQPALREGLEDLVDGFGVVEGAVRDLLDAGFRSSCESDLEDCLSGPAAAGSDPALPLALLRVAAATLDEMEACGIGDRSTLLRRAAERIGRTDQELLPTRELFIHGFADATGLATELLLALQRRFGGTLLLDRPPPPGESQRRDPGLRFGERFRQRLAEVRGTEIEELGAEEPLPSAQPVAVEAADTEAEVRSAALRIAVLLEGGARPESVGVVARDLSPYALSLRRHFERLGVPYSGVGAVGPGGAVRRRAEALVELLRTRERCASDRWLECLPRLSQTQRADLRIGLRHLGAARLGDVVGLPAGRDLPLPVRRGLEGRDVDQPDDARHAEGDADRAAPRASRRLLRRETLRAAVDSARMLLERFGSWPHSAPLAAHLRETRQLLEAELDWDPEVPTQRGVFEELEVLAQASPAELRLSANDYLLVLARRLEGLGGERLGGEGGGVQLLSVMEARARSFEHLFVLGLNRDLFPRSVREDPILPDSVRRVLSRVLPDLPIKSSGYDEERHLFAQLLASSPRVAISWRAADDEGKPLASSTLVERLRWSLPGLRVETAPSPLERLDDDRAHLHPAFERAAATALRGPQAALPAAVRVALEERRRLVGEIGLDLDPAELAEARLAVVRELDRGAWGAPLLGPYFGFVGPARRAEDLRNAPLAVTTLEKFARCPWRCFVEQMLRIERVPDPLEALPGLDPLRLGSAVHRALEQLARGGKASAEGPVRLEEVRESEPRAVAWPGERRALEILREACREILRDEGLDALPGLADLLERSAWPVLERARQLEWPTPDVELAVLGVEVEGDLELLDPTLPEQRRRIGFRADRVDLGERGLVLTDYKTGKPLSTAVKEATRRSHFLDAVRRGDRLQALAYARAAGVREGRYLYLGPESEDDCARYRVEASDPEFGAAFDDCLRVVLCALDGGAFLPRMVEARGERLPCERCQVAEACLSSDSGAVARLRHWLEAASASPSRLGQAEGAALAVWGLYRKPGVSP
jgi:hypothetical protein